MRKICFALFVLLAASCSICNGSGVNITGSYSEEGIDFSEERTPGTFERVATSGPFNVYFVQSPESKVLVEGKKDFVGKLQTSTEDKVLKIKLEDGTYHDLVLRVTVYSPVISGISAAGSGDITVKHGITIPDDLSINTSGTADTTLDELICNNFNYSSAGCGDLYIKSLKTAGNVSCNTAGCADIKIENAEIEGDLNIKSAGTGDQEVNGYCNTFSVKNAGTGEFKGNIECKKIKIQ